MLDIGWSELFVIGIVALVVIGPKDLPVMFRTLGRFVARARVMARDFQRAMDSAADDTGMKDVARDLKNIASPRSMGLDAMQNAAQRFEKWDPLKRPAPTATGAGVAAAAARPDVASAVAPVSAPPAPSHSFAAFPGSAATVPAAPASAAPDTPVSELALPQVAVHQIALPGVPAPDVAAPDVAVPDAAVPAILPPARGPATTALAAELAAKSAALKARALNGHAPAPDVTVELPSAPQEAPTEAEPSARLRKKGATKAADDDANGSADALKPRKPRAAKKGDA